jgi:hypothetical protein
MALFEFKGKFGAGEPTHNKPIGSNVGVILLTISTYQVEGAPQDVFTGVKVRICVPTAEVLITAGLQVPEIPFKELDGSAAA